MFEIMCDMQATREEALDAARALLPDDDTERQERNILNSSDSQTLKQALAKADEVGWMNENLWAGLVPFYGSSAITLVGTPQELAQAFLGYKAIGITQFIISGWPKLEEMVIFGREVIPLVRDAERIGRTTLECGDCRRFDAADTKAASRCRTPEVL